MSAISEEEVDAIDLLHEKRKLLGSLSSKAKATFEEIRRIIYQVIIHLEYSKTNHVVKDPHLKKLKLVDQNIVYC